MRFTTRNIKQDEDEEVTHGEFRSLKLPRAVIAAAFIVDIIKELEV